MDSLDHWRLCDEFSVLDAALLIAGLDPATVFPSDSNFESSYPIFTAAKKSLMRAVMSERLKARIMYKGDAIIWFRAANGDELTEIPSKEYFLTQEPDWENTTILLDDLRAWLSSRGISSGFFFPLVTTDTMRPDYLSPDNPYYAPKLAAAIHAWEHVTANQALLRGKTPKQALEKWLRENASAYKLTKDDGNLNEQGIQETAKIANWKQDGGAPKTPES